MVASYALEYDTETRKGGVDTPSGKCGSSVTRSVRVRFPFLFKNAHTYQDRKSITFLKMCTFFPQPPIRTLSLNASFHPAVDSLSYPNTTGFKSTMKREKGDVGKSSGNEIVSKTELDVLQK